MRKLRISSAFAVMVCALAAAPAGGTSVLSMNLDELSQRAGRIFRGRVIDVRAGSVVGGGGTLPTTIYRIAVEEQFKGDCSTDEDGVPIVEIQMIGGPEEEAGASAGRRIRVLPLLPDVPRLRLHEEYLLFTTVPGPLGLSTTVGLGQGCFRVFRRQNGESVVVNGFGNQNLFRAMTTTLRSGGPAPYGEVVRHIRASVVRMGVAP